MKPSKEEKEVWDRLDECIREEKRIADNLNYFCNHDVPHDMIRDLLEKEQQREYLKAREENRPSWWQRLLGL